MTKCPPYDEESVVGQKSEKLILKGNLEAPVEGLFFHGFRDKRSPEQVKTEGLMYYHTAQSDALADYKDMLMRLGIPEPPPEEQVFEFAKAEGRADPSCRWNFWVTTYPDSACRWAKHGPEVVQLAVERAQHVARQSYEYDQEDAEARNAAIEEKYGKPMAMTIKTSVRSANVFQNPANVCLNKFYIPPEEIVSVCECTEEDYDR